MGTHTRHRPVDTWGDGHRPFAERHERPNTGMFAGHMGTRTPVPDDPHDKGTSTTEDTLGAGVHDGVHPQGPAPVRPLGGARPEGTSNCEPHLPGPGKKLLPPHGSRARARTHGRPASTPTHGTRLPRRTRTSWTSPRRGDLMNRQHPPKGRDDPRDVRPRVRRSSRRRRTGECAADKPTPWMSANPGDPMDEPIPWMSVGRGHPMDDPMQPPRRHRPHATPARRPHDGAPAKGVFLGSQKVPGTAGRALPPRTYADLMDPRPTAGPHEPRPHDEPARCAAPEGLPSRGCGVRPPTTLAGRAPRQNRQKFERTFDRARRGRFGRRLTIHRGARRSIK